MLVIGYNGIQLAKQCLFVPPYQGPSLHQRHISSIRRSIIKRGHNRVTCPCFSFFGFLVFWWWATPPHSCSRHRDCRPWKTAARCLVLWLVFCNGVVVVVVIRQVPKRKGNTAVSHSGHFFPSTCRPLSAGLHLASPDLVHIPGSDSTYRQIHTATSQSRQDSV